MFPTESKAQHGFTSCQLLLEEKYQTLRDWKEEEEEAVIIWMSNVHVCCKVCYKKRQKEVSSPIIYHSCPCLPHRGKGGRWWGR